MHSREVQEVLETFDDLFTENLPRVLAPRRKQEFEMELQEGAKPQKKGIYRLCDEEMSEIRKQLKEILEPELIRPSKSPQGGPILFIGKTEMVYGCMWISEP